MRQTVSFTEEDGRWFVIGDRNSQIMLSVESRIEAVLYSEGWNDAIAECDDNGL